MKIFGDKRGFTIIEILVVITMVGILSTIIVPQITKQLDKAKKGRAIVEIKTLKNAMDIYYAENNTFPSDKASINTLMKENGVLGGNYGKDNADDPWGHPYYITANTSSYTIWSEGPETKDEDKDDIYTSNAIVDIKVNSENLKTDSATTNSNDTT